MKTHRYLLIAAVCWFLAGYAAHAGVPAPLEIRWFWPTETIYPFGDIPLRDASTNFSFVVVSSPVASTSVMTWPVKFVIPATNATLVASNWWKVTVMDDLSFSAFYAIKATNILNRTESDFSPPALWLPTPRGQIERLTKP